MEPCNSSDFWKFREFEPVYLLESDNFLLHPTVNCQVKCINFYTFQDTFKPRFWFCGLKIQFKVYEMIVYMMIVISSWCWTFAAWNQAAANLNLFKSQKSITQKKRKLKSAMICQVFMPRIPESNFGNFSL